MIVLEGVLVRIALVVIFVLPYSHSEKWARSIVLDPDGLYHVHWRTHGDSIDFKLEVQTKGFVGFGLSKNGAMAGSDIVTGWVIDGTVHFQDRHGVGNSIPDIDDRQNWELLSGEENETHTVLVFRRKLQTCDRKQDLEIGKNSLRLIYAFYDEDPLSVDTLRYHGSKRGSRSVLLLQERHGDGISTEDLAYWDALSPNYTIPTGRDTMYWCKIVKGPELQEKHHIIKANPLIQTGNEEYVHHIVIYECTGASAERFEPNVKLSGHECNHVDMPDVFRECGGMIFEWSVGIKEVVWPEHAGLPMDQSPPKYYMMEIHYNNPFRHEGIRDQSGIRFFYTPSLRKFDAGILSVGSTVSSNVVSSNIVIPPRQEKFTISCHSYPECCRTVMPSDGLKIFAMVLHGHLLARRIKVRHFRGEEELAPLGDNANYDMKYQELVFLTEEVQFLPNDQLTVECTYDSRDREFTTFGWLSSRDEMCVAFLLYYPRIDLVYSTSAPRRSLIVGLTGISESAVSNDSSAEYLKEKARFEWENLDISVVEKAMMYSPQESKCMLRNGSFLAVTKLVSYPMNYKPYAEVDTCPEELLIVSDATTMNFSLYFGFAMQLAVVEFWLLY